MAIIRAKGRSIPVDESLIAAIESDGLARVMAGREGPLAPAAEADLALPRMAQVERQLARQEHASSLRTLNSEWFFDDPRRLPSHRKHLGALTIRLRRWLLGLMRILLFPTFERQRTFNAAVAQHLNELNGALLAASRDLGHLFRRLAVLIPDVEELRQAVDARLEERIRELERQSSERLSNADARVQALTGRMDQMAVEAENLYHHLLNLGIVFFRCEPDRAGARSAEFLRRFPELRYVRCLLCGADETEPVGEKEGLRVVRCRRCGLMYVNPRLPEEIVQELYSESYWYERQAEYGLSNIVERFAYDYILALGRLPLIRKHRLTGRLIDVGCSNGAFVRRAAEWGFEAMGLELDARVAGLARKISGVPVLAGSIHSQELEERSFDVITLFDLLEHLYNPFAFLHRARALLGPEGILVLETFRTDVPAFLANPERHDIFEPLEHVYMYTEANIEELLGRCRFEVVETTYPLGESNLRVLKVCRPSDRGENVET